MTAAQKANVARFKAVQAEAKKLKAKNKNLTHIQAVKQAWAIMLHKKPAAKKKAAKKVGAVKKKAAPKKKATTKKSNVRNYGSHKDTASHNVKISVMSGTKLGAIDLNIVGKELLQLNKDITELGYFIKNEKLIKEKNRLKEIQTIKKQQYKTLRLYLNSIAAFR
jgi:hypothetical protein